MFVAILVSVLWTLWLYSVLGFNYNVLTSILPLVLVLAMADDVHIIQHFDQSTALGQLRAGIHVDRRASVRAALRGQRDTALGMASLATYDIVAVREFGIGSAVGVMVDFVLSIVSCRR